MLTSVLLLMQFVISAKAGLVNYVDGVTNVHRQQQVEVGVPIETQSGGHAELLLNPGSFLRIGENSTVVFDSVALNHIAVRIVSGSALIESASLGQFPIHVTSGNLHLSIVSSGVYRFSGDVASVLDGKLKVDLFGQTAKKGQQITSGATGYEVTKVVQTAAAADLDMWSRQRSSDLAQATKLAYRNRSTPSYNSYVNYSSFGLFPAAWMYSPFLGGFTFLPYDTYRSYYGYSFVPVTKFAPNLVGPVINRPAANPGTSPANSAANQAPTSNSTRVPAPSRPANPSGPSNGGGNGRWDGGGGHAPMHPAGSSAGGGASSGGNGGGGGGHPAHSGGSRRP